MTRTLAVVAAAALAGAFSLSAFSADDAYKTARKQASDTYKADKKACKGMKGAEEKDHEQVKAKHDQAMASAKGMKKEPPSLFAGLRAARRRRPAWHAAG